MVRGIVIVGACYLDTILTVSHYPAEDEKLRANAVVTRRGGNGPNTLEVLAQLFHHTSSTIGTQLSPTLHLISVLPDAHSSATAEIQDSLRPHIDTSCSVYRSGEVRPASSYIIRSLASGSRTIVNHNPLQEMTVEEFTSRLSALVDPSVGSLDNDLTGGWHIHFEGRIPDVTLGCLQFLRSKYPTYPITISVEIEKPQRAGLAALADLADLVFYSRSWAAAEGYTSAKQCLEDQATKVKAGWLFCTWGDGPSAFHMRSGKVTVEVPPDSLDKMKIVDAVGAGDTFIAGVLYRITSDPESVAGEGKVVRFANRLAGLKIQREGFDGLADDMFDASGRSDG